ncbi:MAG: preprotein translocase subunit SecE [Planctomycetes bacterium]|nr:preprotein translocase subunit SecE [Planctomycetota bacterium]
MTAALSGLLIAAGAGWLWQQLGIVSLPTPTWRMTVRDGGAAFQPNQQVELLAKGAQEGEFVKIGAATARSWEELTRNQHQLVVGDVTMEGTHSPSDTQGVRPADKADAMGLLEGKPGGIPIFQRVYLQAAGAGLMLMAGAFMIYWYVGLKPRTVDFLIATDAEMKKVNWSTRREITIQTQVVIVAFFLIAALIFVIDFIFQGFFKLIHVIRLG